LETHWNTVLLVVQEGCNALRLFGPRRPGSVPLKTLFSPRFFFFRPPLISVGYVDSLSSKFITLPDLPLQIFLSVPQRFRDIPGEVSFEVRRESDCGTFLLAYKALMWVEGYPPVHSSPPLAPRNHSMPRVHFPFCQRLTVPYVLPRWCDLKRALWRFLFSLHFLSREMVWLAPGVPILSLFFLSTPVPENSLLILAHLRFTLSPPTLKIVFFGLVLRFKVPSLLSRIRGKWLLGIEDRLLFLVN